MERFHEIFGIAILARMLFETSLLFFRDINFSL